MARAVPIAVVVFLTACGGGSSQVDTAAPQIPLAGQDTTHAGNAARGLHLVRIGGFNSPTYLTAPPRDTHRLFVVEQQGTIRVVRDRRVLRTPFLDIRSDVQAGGEQGLLSMAFAPDYATSRRFYVYFTGRDGDIRIQEFRASAGNRNVADRSTRRQLLRIEHS
ncbi:MAG: PQQ-dependent sugar dehydrogenase, partial [Thermoleophilaceae bacterium]